MSLFKEDRQCSCFLYRYMMPALLPFYPSHAANILRYRYNSLNESNHIARVFGYDGSMFAWTAYVLSTISEH